jgi:hypothetical protein
MPEKSVNPKAEAPKEAKETISSVACTAVMAGKTNDEVIAAVKAKFPDAKTSLASINWYRNNLRKQGKDVPKPARKVSEKKAAPAEKKAAAGAAEKKAAPAK